MTDKLLSMVGLATRAGRTASGEFAVESSVKKGKAALVIIACDASENTKKSFRNMCDYYQVPLILYGTRESLGQACGRDYRASLAILDSGFAKAIQKLNV